MAEKEPRGRARAFTDAELRQDLADKLKVPAIAKKYSVSRQAVYQRIDQLEKSTLAAAVAPEESRRHVAATINVLEELSESLVFVKRLRAACDRYLEDPDRPGEYDVGPRASEITVIYLPLNADGEPKTRKPQRKSLAELLEEVSDFGEHQVLGAESKHADPRTLVIQTCAEIRQLVSAAVELARFLGEAKRMEEFREDLLAEIAAESPEARARILARIRSRLLLHAAVRGPDVLPG